MGEEGYGRGTIELDTPLEKYPTGKFIDGNPRLDLMTARRVTPDH
jgi:hypothetical protein